MTGDLRPGDEPTQLRRRHLLAAFLAVPAWPLLDAALIGYPAQAGLAKTPPCGGPTREVEEGPFFRRGAPDRHALVEPGSAGERIAIAGSVVDAACRPVPGALVQVWHADHAGDYDDRSNRFRGLHRTDDRGRWWFTTIVPALYPGRTRHYHLKVQRPGGTVLTTQLFFPGEARNDIDGLFDERLLLRMERTTDGRFGRYDFVV